VSVEQQEEKTLHSTKHGFELAELLNQSKQVLHQSKSKLPHN
jgi:hypothetical protein